VRHTKKTVSLHHDHVSQALLSSPTRPSICWEYSQDEARCEVVLLCAAGRDGLARGSLFSVQAWKLQSQEGQQTYFNTPSHTHEEREKLTLCLLVPLRFLKGIEDMVRLLSSPEVPSCCGLSDDGSRAVTMSDRRVGILPKLHAGDDEQPLKPVQVSILVGRPSLRVVVRWRVDCCRLHHTQETAAATTQPRAAKKTRTMGNTTSLML
jgi:hypothetical protein